MAGPYPLPGQSLPGRADETPIREETADRHLSNIGLSDDDILSHPESLRMRHPKAREIRGKLKFKGGRLLTDPDTGDPVDWDTSVVFFEDADGKKHTLQEGDDLPGFPGFRVGVIGTGRRGLQVEVNPPDMKDPDIVFDTGSGGWGFDTGPAEARELGRTILGEYDEPEEEEAPTSEPVFMPSESEQGYWERVTANRWSGLGVTSTLDVMIDSIKAFDEALASGEFDSTFVPPSGPRAPIDLDMFPPGTVLSIDSTEHGFVEKRSTDDPDVVEYVYEDGQTELWSSEEEHEHRMGRGSRGE